MCGARHWIELVHRDLDPRRSAVLAEVQDGCGTACLLRDKCPALRAEARLGFVHLPDRIVDVASIEHLDPCDPSFLTQEISRHERFIARNIWDIALEHDFWRPRAAREQQHRWKDVSRCVPIHADDENLP